MYLGHYLPNFCRSEPANCDSWGPKKLCALLHMCTFAGCKPEASLRWYPCLSGSWPLVGEVPTLPGYIPMLDHCWSWWVEWFHWHVLYGGLLKVGIPNIIGFSIWMPRPCAPRHHHWWQWLRCCASLPAWANRWMLCGEKGWFLSWPIGIFIREKGRFCPKVPWNHSF